MNQLFVCLALISACCVDVHALQCYACGTNVEDASVRNDAGSDFDEVSTSVNPPATTSKNDFSSDINSSAVTTTEATQAITTTEATQAITTTEATQAITITEATQAITITEATQATTITEATQATTITEATQATTITEATQAHPSPAEGGTFAPLRDEGRCMEPFSATEARTVECNDACLKVVMEKEGRPEVIMRGCDPAGKAAAQPGCSNCTGKSGASCCVYTCSSDLCNGAGSLTFSPMTTTAILVITFLLSRAPQ